ncbi:rRNA pseudouridine synthase [bacterium]|nr:rRNA pseudouridine synthase [bacterium]
MKPQRLDKVLAHLGVGSRKEVSRLIRSRRVRVDGEAIRDPAYKLDPSQQSLKIDGEPIAWSAHFHLMLHKPQGFLSANHDSEAPTVMDLLPPEVYREDFLIVGRLDKDTEGLVLFTTDGMLLHRLTHPRWHLPKRYLAELDTPATDEDVNAFAEGILLEGDRLKPAELFLGENPQQVEVVVYEGKFHQVRRMFAKQGREVVRLKRLAIGPLLLDEALFSGEFRYLLDEEVAALYEAVQLDRDGEVQ